MAMPFSRRQFMLAAGASLAARARPARAQASFTAAALVDRIKTKLGIPWNSATYRDTFKVGRPENDSVRGIASTSMSTYDVIRRAHAGGMMVPSRHEPLLERRTCGWLPHARRAGPGRSWRTRTPTGWSSGAFTITGTHACRTASSSAGSARWGGKRYVMPEDDRRLIVPETTLGQLATHVGSALQSRGVRMVGNASTRIRTVTRGAHTLVGNLAALPTADALIVSEARERHSIEYVRDTLASGQAKGIALIPHEAGAKKRGWTSARAGCGRS